MIKQEDIDKIKELSVKYNAGKVILFGSCLDPNRQSRDIDLGIDGIAPKDYYRYCSELMMTLTKPVDIVDLSVPCKFIDIILEDGMVIYG